MDYKKLYNLRAALGRQLSALNFSNPDSLLIDTVLQIPYIVLLIKMISRLDCSVKMANLRAGLISQ